MKKIRLQKLIADAGIMSRRAAEKAIKAGKVTLNGHPANLGDKADYKDAVTINGKRIHFERKAHTYIMINKPRGYLSSTSDDRGRKCVTELIEGIDARIYPVGRLDLNSEGMLLLTDDGELKNKLTHPSHNIAKIYRVKVSGKVNDEQYEILTSELVIDGYKIRPVDVKIAGSDESGTVLKMTLFEGRNRQIRKMCEAAGLSVRRLTRVSIGKLKLDGLAPGQWRLLSDAEVEYLVRETKKVNV